jgi:hypothetical protein
MRRTHIIASFAGAAIVLLAGAVGLNVNRTSGMSNLTPGQMFEVIGDVYALSVANDLDVRKPELISIVPLNLRGPEILASQRLPYGSVVQIVRKDDRRRPQIIYPHRYLIVSRAVENPANLPITLDLAQGNEGESTPLNPKLYRQLRSAHAPHFQLNSHCLSE